MPQLFTIQTSSRFFRDARKLLRRHPELAEVLEDLRTVLGEDPYNRSKRHDIRKLVDVDQGEGQWRIRHGGYRLRYDIVGTDVVLCSFRDRRDMY